LDKHLATSQGDIQIRLAVPKDAAPLRELRLEALAAHPEAFAADYAATAADPVETWSRLIADYAATGKGVVCVATIDGGLIGMVGLVRGHWPKTHHCGELWGVYVRPAWRGLRLAGALLQECGAWAQEHGLTVLKLGVTTTNAPAIRCYARFGFRVYGIDPQAIRYNDIDFDELLMAMPAQAAVPADRPNGR
jgi:ribosomal protein S18 acetylase RimI-like enzyme